MRAGQLRRRVQIQKPVTTTDSEGTETIVWWPALESEDGTTGCWADIEWTAGRERMEAEQLENPRTVQVIIRNPPGTAITAAMRVVYGTRVFEITSVIPDQEPPRSLTLTCTELHP